MKRESFTKVFVLFPTKIVNFKIKGEREEANRLEDSLRLCCEAIRLILIK